MEALIDSKTALERTLASLPDIPSISCPIDKCAGRILRERVKADRPFPPFDRSMMDGFALRASNAKLGAVFTITGTAPAGHPQTALSSEANSCVEIMTGAILPVDADCVVPYEDCQRRGENEIEITDAEPIKPGDFVHRLGSDFPDGEILLEPGARLGSHQIAVAATCGYSELQVSKIPSIAIACSGDELVEITSKPAPYQIRRSNDYAIETALSRAQLNAATRTHLPDEPSILRKQLQELISENNFVLLSGGVSKGKRDFIPELLSEIGLHCRFHGVAQRPGKTMGLWTQNDCAVFALPGNPLSTLTCLHHYVLPAIRRAMGDKYSPPNRIVSITSDYEKPTPFTLFLPVKLEPDDQAKLCPQQNSGDLVSVLKSDGYIEVPAEQSITKGSRFTFYPWL